MDRLEGHGTASTAVLLLGVTLLYKFILHPVFLSPLARIPTAHWSCSLSSSWMLWARFRNRENETLFEAHRRHGPVVRVAPSEVSINNMETVKTVYGGGFDKHEWYAIFNNFG